MFWFLNKMTTKRVPESSSLLLIKNKTNMKTVKKSNRGRKPISDKKVQVSLYIRQSKIDKFGGIDGLKDALYEFVDLRSSNGA